MSEKKISAIQNEQARMMANLTIQLEKFCQIKDQFFSSKFKLTPAEFRCLRIIKENNAVSTKALAQQMKLTPGRITHLLNSLEFKNLISRQIDKNDRRGIQTYITPDAVSFIDNVIKEYTKLHEEILEYLPKEKRDVILENVVLFFDAMQKWESRV
ncbi:MAG: MarR family transcriptional regulator [Ignavibacteriae bacterium]|nr:MarR family transcriptional regulator [Ignavibacteriota bacterium]